VSLAKEVADGSLAQRRSAWLAYLAGGRRPRVERFLTKHGGRLTTTPSAEVPDTDEDGWWQLDTGAAVEALCGPGWSFPEPGSGTWLEGTEGRLSLPLEDRPATGAQLVVELVLTVLGHFGGPSRVVRVRAAGRTLATLTAERDNASHHLSLPVPVPEGPSFELSLLVRHPGQPDKLGIGPDRRRLGLMVHRIRLGDGAPRSSVHSEWLDGDGSMGTVLVTGARGLVGTALVDRLRSEGWRVRGFDLKGGDDLRDERALLDAARGCGAIVHAGAIPHDSAGTPADIVETNVLGTWHVLLAAERAGVSRVVYLSSVHVFGFADGAGTPAYVPVDDDHPLRASRPYGMSKRLAEEMCAAWTSRTGIPTVVLRPVLVLGDAGLARTSEGTVELGAYVHVDDAVDASIRALGAELEGHHRITICGPGPFDTSLAQRVLGWKATRGWPTSPER
jgi:NAD(P)-dependent dehydrogenase (short-subunit alcohol dehydrogenase family)